MGLKYNLKLYLIVLILSGVTITLEHFNIIILEFIKGIISFALIFFLPGVFLSFLILGNKKMNLENIILSFGISSITLPSIIFYLNYFFNLEISGLNSILIVNIICILTISLNGIMESMNKE